MSSTGHRGRPVDVAIVGGGMAGITAALHARRRGARVVLFEPGSVGGTWITRGCIPTKALVRAAELAHDVRHRAAEFGIRVTAAEIDFAAVMTRVRRIIDEGSRHYEQLLAERGVELVRAPARFVSETELEAGDVRVAFAHALLATGSRPRRLEVPGAADVPWVTSDDLLEATELPEHLVSVGAGAVSLEFAQAYRRLGARVTIVQRGEHLAHGEDEELGDLLKGYLEEEGVEVLTASEVEGLEVVDGRPAVGCVGGTRVVGDTLLMAVGREPVVEGLGLEEVGIAFGDLGVVVDDHLRTTLPNVWSVGDVVGGMMFTHVATYQAPLAVANMLDGASEVTDYRTMPRAIFTDPVLAAAGLTEREARLEGYDVEIRRSDVGTRGKARAIGDRRGRVKFVLERGTGAILGVGILARDGADLLPGPLVAMNAPGGTLAPLLATTHVHPTISEAVKVAARLD